MDRKTLKRVEWILDELYTHRLSPVLEGDVRDWFRTNGHIEEKYATLEDIFKKSFNSNPTPSPDAYTSYEDAAKLMVKRDPDWNLPFALYWHAKHRGRLWKNIAIGVVAVLVPLIVITTYMYLDNQNTPQEISSTPTSRGITVDTGEAPQKARLHDGTQIWINAGSSLSYIDDRTVSLDGEAYFAVVHNPDRPFTVKTSQSTVTVHGTEFNVKAYADKDQPEITLFSGIIDIETGSDRHRMKPGEQMTLHRNSKEPTIAQAESFKPNWMLSKLHFEGVALREILKSIEWYYDITVKYDNTLNINDPYGLILRGDESIDEVMLILQAISGEFKYSRHENTITMETINPEKK